MKYVLLVKPSFLLVIYIYIYIHINHAHSLHSHLGAHELMILFKELPTTPGDLPTALDLPCETSRAVAGWPGGEGAALRRLEDYMAGPIETYADALGKVGMRRVFYIP